MTRNQFYTVCEMCLKDATIDPEESLIIGTDGIGLKFNKDNSTLSVHHAEEGTKISFIGSVKMSRVEMKDAIAVINILINRTRKRNGIPNSKNNRPR